MDALEPVVWFAGIAAFYVLLCAGELVAKWLMKRFDRFAAWMSEPDATEDELVDRIRDGGV